MTAYTAERAHAAVKRGAAWLDKQCPRWFEEIDLEKLDLANGNLCVLGQTAACILGDSSRNADGYGAVLRAKGISSWGPWPVQRGFNVPERLGETYREESVRYEMLTIAWREYIRERLAVPA